MTKLRDQLIEFHQAAGQPILDRPQVPPDERVRLRLKLVAEECFEFLEASLDDQGMTALAEAKTRALEAIQMMAIKVDLPAVADALGDIDYVVEGSRLEFGIDGEPVADEIQRSNMAKFGPGSWTREDGKIMKPPGWRPPDIKRQLRLQGWKG